MDVEELLDFEREDPLAPSPVAARKRKKVIGLDDLLTDYYKERSKNVEKEAKKRAKAPKNYNSDEDETGKEAKLSEIVNLCQKQMKEMSSEEEISHWGIRVFGNQKTPPPFVFPELEGFSLLQSFVNSELNSLVGLTAETGCSFLEGLLINGWLSRLVFKCGYLEKSIATWTFNLMLYSSKEEVRSSACDFWCSILSPINEVGKLPIKIEWLPTYMELKRALETYGFLFNFSSNPESVNPGSDGKGPPQNVGSWFKITTACCQVRDKQSIFLTSEAEELVEVIVWQFLDRQLQGLSVVMYNCMQSALTYFSADEWNTSCAKIANSLACRIPRDLNCLRAVECISGPDTRSKQLRSALAFQILVNCLEKKTTDEEGILNMLISLNVKEKDNDFFKMYIYLVLTENWLLYDKKLEDKPVIMEMWGLFLRNCSCQISSMDLRSYASKVRSKASFLLQGTSCK
ncbi:hypothetical protein SLA2020_374750 [Shorea laevis]